jgi:hypothetical protein
MARRPHYVVLPLGNPALGIRQRVECAARQISPAQLRPNATTPHSHQEDGNAGRRNDGDGCTQRPTATSPGHHPTRFTALGTKSSCHLDPVLHSVQAHNQPQITPKPTMTATRVLHHTEGGEPLPHKPLAPNTPRMPKGGTELKAVTWNAEP